MVQKRPAQQRTDKYTAKISADVIGNAYDNTKKMATDQQKVYFEKAEKLEMAVKRLIDGSPSIMQHFYIAFAEEYSTKTTAPEKSICFTKWAMRGLDWFYLLRIANEFFGGVPELGGEGFTPPTAGYWSFHEGKGAIAYDLSGNNNHGTIIGASWVVGKIGNALFYDGLTNDINIAKAYMSAAATYIFWINPIDLVDDRIIFSTSHYTSLAGRTGRHIFFGFDRRIKFRQIEGAVSQDLTSIKQIIAGKWNQIVITINGAVGKVYINGIFDNQKINFVPLSTASSNVSTIGVSTAFSRWFNGTIDEGIIFAEEKSADFIKKYYEATKRI